VITNPFSTQAASNFGLFLARATLGMYLAAIGYRGVLDGVSNFARANLKYMPTWLKPQYSEVFLTLYPVVHVVAGILLALGICTRISAFCLASTLLVYIVCRTGFQGPEGMPFEPNVIFLAIAIALLTNGGGNLTLPFLLGKKGGGSAAAPKAATPAPAAK
jgi:uncharacterized membrane protein YphA (DoxX/SURF4 family)